MIRRGLQLASNWAQPVWTAPLGCGSRGVGTKADLNKGDLIKILRERGNMSEARARETMEAVLQEIKTVVSTGRLCSVLQCDVKLHNSLMPDLKYTLSYAPAGGKATLSGFGTFKWTLRSGRSGVNPKTREKIRYPSRVSIS